MGLLDDAIREHLELKRLRGADPSDVAREQDAALGPVHGGDEPELGDAPGDRVEGGPPEESLQQSTDAPTLTTASAGQETVEINMEAELAGSDFKHDPPRGAAHEAAAAHPARPHMSRDESLEWEVPSDRRGDRDTTVGEETPSDSDVSGANLPQGEEAPVEDVLEETPDFLRDTPEQERLWFEQRPPRDFDFNE